MDSIIVLIMAGALAAAVILGGLVVKLTLAERRRAAARVAFLTGLASEAAGSAVPRERTPDVDLRYADVAEFGLEPEPEPLRTREVREVAPRLRAASAGWRETSIDQPAELEPAQLFAAPAHRSAWPRRAAIGAALAATIFGVAAGLRSIGGSSGATPAASSATNVPQLDLMSLKHTQDTDAMTIVGLVHNPVNGPMLPNVFATALLFDADGSFLASGRAPLDFGALGPNGESGFVIKVPVSAPVARYRIGFRAEDGRVIGHVDRRSASAIARGPS
jgi:hypothetical protein